MSKNNMSRRKFNKMTLLGVSMMTMTNSIKAKTDAGVRLGGPIFDKTDDPDLWLQAHQRLGYKAAYCPVEAEVSDDIVSAFKQAARRANIVIAEVGAWSNPISQDETERKQAIEKCIRQLELADRIDALCCVNISGSRGQKWDGPDVKNLTSDTFDMIVTTTRHIIDQVKPERTFFTLEPMPWAYPDSADSYLRLVKAINRKQFAVHLDPVNIINSPWRYFNTGAVIRECFQKLGPYLKSCHAKDILLQDTLTTHLDEAIPGQGNLDYTVYLAELSKLSDVPLMLEHLKLPEEYQQAADYIRAVAKRQNIAIS